MKNDKTESQEDLEKQSTNTNSSSKGKGVSNKIKETLAAIFAAAVLISVVGPIGITLGVILMLFVFRKPLLKYSKKALKRINKRREIQKIKKDKLKLKQKTLENKHRVSKSSTLEMDKDSLRKMKTRDKSVSKINILPHDRSKSTSNEIQSKAKSFHKFTKPSIDLSKKALKRRQHPTLSRSNSMPSRTIRPTLK